MSGIFDNFLSFRIRTFFIIAKWGVGNIFAIDNCFLQKNDSFKNEIFVNS